MNFKKICFISLFLLFLVLNTSCAQDLENSTDAISQVHDEDLIPVADSIIDLGEWILDENGNLVYVPSTGNGSLPHIDIPTPEGNVTDIRNNNKTDLNSTDIFNESESIEPIKTPASMSTMMEEFIKDPQGYLERYHSMPDNISVYLNEDIYNNSSCNTRYYKEFDEFMKFVEETKVKPDVIESKDISVFYSKNNIYTVRIINPVSDPVCEGVNVTFTFNNRKITVKTDADGYASFKFNAQPGNYVVKVSAGDKNSKNKIAVKALFKTKNVNKIYKKSSKFTVRLIKQNGKSVSKQIVKVTFKGKNYKIKTNSKGIASFNIPKGLKVGKYTIKTNYNGCAVKNRITVKR